MRSGYDGVGISDVSEKAHGLRNPELRGNTLESGTFGTIAQQHQGMLCVRAGMGSEEKLEVLVRNQMANADEEAERKILDRRFIGQTPDIGNVGRIVDGGDLLFRNCIVVDEILPDTAGYRNDTIRMGIDPFYDPATQASDEAITVLGGCMVRLADQAGDSQDLAGQDRCAIRPSKEADNQIRLVSSKTREEFPDTRKHSPVGCEHGSPYATWQVVLVGCRVQQDHADVELRIGVVEGVYHRCKDALGATPVQGVNHEGKPGSSSGHQFADRSERCGVRRLPRVRGPRGTGICQI